MKKYKKILLVTSAALIIGGGIMVSAGLAMGARTGFRFTKEGIKTAQDYMEQFVEKTADLKGIKKLTVNTSDADIQFLEGDAFRIEYGYNESNDTMEEKRDGSGFTLTHKHNQNSVFWQGFSMGEIQTDYVKNYVRIYLPKKQKLEQVKVDNDYGTIRFTTGDADDFIINCDSGDVTIDGLSSKSANIDMGYGKLLVGNSQLDNLIVENDSGDVTIEGVNSKNAGITMGYGKNQISDSKIDVLSVQNESGKGEFSNLTGSKLEGVYSYGEVILTDIGMKQINIKSESGRISAGNVIVKKDKDDEGALSLHAGYGNVDLEQVEADTLDITSDSGQVNGKAVKIKSGLMKMNSGACTITDFTVAALDVQSEYGDIKMELTEQEASYDFELLTDYGEVSINGDKQGNNMVREKGAKNKIKLSAESGNIKINTK